jgi:hypothetical protein
MQEETPTKAMPSGREFILPAELLKAFKSDVRILKPGQLAGFIIFDMKMLATVLNHGTDTERRELAKQIENVGKAGGEMVIVQPQ